MAITMGQKARVANDPREFTVQNFDPGTGMVILLSPTGEAIQVPIGIVEGIQGGIGPTPQQFMNEPMVNASGLPPPPGWEFTAPPEPPLPPGGLPTPTPGGGNAPGMGVHTGIGGNQTSPSQPNPFLMNPPFGPPVTPPITSGQSPSGVFTAPPEPPLPPGGLPTPTPGGGNAPGMGVHTGIGGNQTSPSPVRDWNTANQEALALGFSEADAAAWADQEFPGGRPTGTGTTTLPGAVGQDWPQYKVELVNGEYRRIGWNGTAFADMGPADQNDILRYQAEIKGFADTIGGVGTGPGELTPRERTIQDAYGHIAYWDDKTKTFTLPEGWGANPNPGMTEEEKRKYDLIQKDIDNRLKIDEAANKIAQQRADLEQEIADAQDAQAKAALEQQKKELDFRYADLEEQKRQAEEAIKIRRDELGADTDYKTKSLAIQQQLADIEKERLAGKLTPQDNARLDMEKQRLTAEINYNNGQLAIQKQLADLEAEKAKGNLTPRDIAQLDFEKQRLEQEAKFEQDRMEYQREIDNKRVGIDQQLADLEEKKAGNLNSQQLAQLEIQRQQLALQQKQLEQDYKLATELTPLQREELDIERGRFDLDKQIAQLDMDLKSGKIITPQDRFNMQLQLEQLKIQRESLKPPVYESPLGPGGGGGGTTGGAPKDSYGRVATWNQRLGQWDYPPNWEVDPATLAAGYAQPMTAYQQAQINLERQRMGNESQFASSAASRGAAQTAMEQQRLDKEMGFRQKELEQEQQNYLAKLGAQPVSWIEYAMAKKEPPAVQPWMLPLMPGQYGNLQPGQLIPQGGVGQPPQAGAGVWTNGVPLPPGTTPEQFAQQWGAQGQPAAQPGATPEQAQQWASQQPQAGGQPGMPGIQPGAPSVQPGAQPPMTKMQWIAAGKPKGQEPLWMRPRVQAGAAGTFDPKNMPGLTTPSMQYWSRVGPTAQQEYLGYEQARTGAKPEETQWRLWQTAAPAGPALPVRYRR